MSFVVLIFTSQNLITCWLRKKTARKFNIAVVKHVVRKTVWFMSPFDCQSPLGTIILKTGWITIYHFLNLQFFGLSLKGITCFLHYFYYPVADTLIEECL